MNKKQLLPLTIFLVLIVSIITYFLFDSSESKIVEINFVSNCTVCDQGENVPTRISMFADVYTDDENGIEYISKLSFKRLDLDRPTDTVLFSKSVDNSSIPSEVLKMYQDERNYISAPVGMHVNEPKTDNRSVENEVKMVKHFYLVCQGSSKVDNRVYFDSQDLLKKHISEEIKTGRLNEDGFKPNSIVIVLDCCGHSQGDIIVEPGPEPPGPRDSKPDPGPGETPVKKFPGNIKQSGNTISWNPDLATADQLTITFKSEVDGNVLVSEYVTGQSSYYFSYSNSVYEGSKIKVSITGNWNNGSKISGSSSLTTTTLECH